MLALQPAISCSRIRRFAHVLMDTPDPTICSIMSKFFSLGQVIETVRGGGIFQPAIDDAIRKLGDGEWVGRPIDADSALTVSQVNIFPEGKVNQPNLHPPGGMRRFKWGV